MKGALLSIVLISLHLSLKGQTPPVHPDLGLNGVVTWIDDTHVRVVYDWSSDAQLLDWLPTKGGTNLVRGNKIVTVSGGTSEVRAMQWKQGIKCSRILAENVKTGTNLHVNIYTNTTGAFSGLWNPDVNIGAVLRGPGSFWLVNGVPSDLPGYGPKANTPETYELIISTSGMNFKSSSDNVLHTYSGVLVPVKDRFVVLGAYQDNTEWGKLTIEGEVTAPWQNEPVPLNTINIQSNGASFAPILQVVGNPVIEWVFDDGTTSASANPVKNYGSTGSRHNYLKVTPWSAVVGLNLGYDASDGGYSPDIAIHASQNVLGFQNFGLLKGSLKRLSMLANPITMLDLTGFTALEFLEFYNCNSLNTLLLQTHPNLERICVENCHLSTINLSGCNNLTDLRGGYNGIHSINWGSIGLSLSHLCIPDNPDLDSNIPALAQFPELKQLWIWNDDQEGAFVCNSTYIESIESYNNNYTSADISGCVNLTVFLLSGSKLASLDLGDANSLLKVELIDCELSGELTDYVLQTLDQAGLSNGSAVLTGNEAPSSEGMVHLYNLRERGWTIEIDVDNQSDFPGVIVKGNQITIYFNDDYSQWNIGLNNLQGSLVFRQTANSNVCEIDMSYFTPGIYILVLSSGDQLKVVKIPNI
jgi:hypothetical protein